MADVNYVSPSSLLPKTDTVPLPAFMLGNQYADQMRDYKDQLSLQNVVSGMGAQKQRGQLEDYFSTRDSTNSALNAKNNAEAQTVLQRMTGEAQTAAAKGKLDMGTVDSDIATKMAENLSKQGAAGLTNLRTGIKLAQHASQMQGPQAAAEIAKIGRDYNLPQGMVQRIIQNPQKMQEFLMSIDDKVQGKLLEDTNTHNLTNAGNLAVAKENRASARDVASINAQKAVEAAQLRAQFGMSFEKLRGMLAAKMARGEQLSPDERQSLDWMNQVLGNEKTAGVRQQQAGTASATQGAIPAPAAVQPPPAPGGTVSPGTKLDATQLQAFKAQMKAKYPNKSDAEIEAGARKLGYM